MDDAWHAKCSSAWPPPPPASSSVPPLPAPPPGSVNQMGMNSRHFSHPFAQEMNLGDSAIVQEPMVFNTLNLDSCKSARAELTNSFLSLLSGHPHHVSSEALQLPYSRSPLAKPQVCDSGKWRIPPSMANGEFSPFVASRPLSTFSCTKPPLQHNDFPTASHCHGPSSRKPALHQAFQSNIAGIEVSSRRHGWTTASGSLNANQQRILNQTSQKMPLEPKPSISSRPSNFRGRPRVFCMNKVGELFVSDMGLLGVLCFCHKMAMSMAKFCEHSGSSSADPGEAVHLENGMTVAQWRMLCSGIMASDHDNGWDWSDGYSSASGLVISKSSNFPTSSKNPVPINSNEEFYGLGRFEEHPKKFVFANHTYTGLGGKAALERSANKDTGNAHQRNDLRRHDHFQEAHSSLNKGKQSAKPQFVSNNVNYLGEIRNQPLSFPRSGMWKTSGGNRDISRGNFSSEAFVADQEVGTSNIELRLGHPSQNNHISGSSFPNAVHSLQFGAIGDLQNPQLHQMLTRRTDYPKEEKRATPDLHHMPAEVASLNRRKLENSVGSNYYFKNSEPEDPMCDATKYSLISFLSHLSTEGNKPSKSTDDIGSDIDSLYAKFNLSGFTRDTADGIERKSNTNRSYVPNNIDQGKELRNRDHNAHVIHRSTSPVSNGTTRPGSINSETPMSLSLTNSIYMSEQASALPNKKNTDRHNNLSNESLRSLSLRNMAELSKPEQSSCSLETSHQRRRVCCLSEVELQKNVRRDDLMAPKELREGPCCIIQQDASKIAIRSSNSFSNCYPDGNAGLYKCCNCTASPQRIQLCSKEHCIQLSTSHICRAHEQPCLRLGRISKNNYSGSVNLDMCNQREESPSFSGKCCCTVLPKYLTGGCFSGGDNLSSALNGHACGKAKLMHVDPVYDNDHMLQDGTRTRQGHCDCVRKHVVIKNDYQIAHWKDVPNKVTRKIGDQLTETAVNDLQGTQQESESLKEQQMSNVCSGSSAPAVTEASIEANNAVSRIDEGSRIEKCGSSGEAHDSRECEEAIIFKDKVNPSSSSSDLMDEHRLKSSSNLKRSRNQITSGSRGEENISQIWQFERPGKAEKRKGPMKCSVLDSSAQQLCFSSIYSEFSGNADHLSNQSSSEEIETPPQPDNLMQISVKRKRSTLSSTKAFSKEELTKIVKKKDTHIPAGKPPKYISLSCIGHSPIHGMDASCKKARPVVSGNSGIISSGLSDQKRLAKIVPLSLILKRASRCSTTVYEGKPRPASILKTRLDATGGCCKALSSSKLQSENADSGDVMRNGAGPSLVSGNEHCTPNLSSRKIIKRALLADLSLVNRSQNDQDHVGELCEENTRRSSKGTTSQSSLLDSDTFCCVCGSSNKEDVNNLLECNRCLIRVHQACYGVSKVPKGHWYCRPCKANSLNIVCVLCGYGGGAMTRALKSRNIVRSLLQAWKVGIGSDLINSSPSKLLKNEFLEPSPFSDASECDGLVYVSKMDIKMSSTTQYSDCLPTDFEACNNIAAGILDPSITQWVHMVCGLWTPGTRCPNVDTMSTFDVSGASPARKNIVCSMCNRAGGSCIQCRVLNCSIHFHPWCAHQKGLLQSEIEGDDNENVGFYGRCMLHATHKSSHINPVDAEVKSPRNRDWTCARTEGFKGRKRDEGFNPNNQKPYNDGGGCIVSQEQINAWLHINGQKSCTRVVVKLPYSDTEYDIRKEYIRYKQSKGWKQLVVYKSGIHALGLYTSQFIVRGAMVVEYVGEIVGLRVADKREIEYQSGTRLQYKSACYFFRIDKEHIIDATRKGGIARFVNHSCLPNCVAKIISVRNEKKVVFFAERDIYPGEEITYDYHFNHEDEGKKIPCFCKSKNCRRYLN